MGARAACLWILLPRRPSGGRGERWWSWTESNRRPPACKAGALPTELQPPHALVGLDGFEPSTPALSRRCSNQLSYRPLKPVFGNRRLISAGALAPTDACPKRQTCRHRLQRQPISVSTGTPRVFRERR